MGRKINIFCSALLPFLEPEDVVIMITGSSIYDDKLIGCWHRISLS